MPSNGTSSGCSSNTTTSKGSNVSGNSQFSAASGDVPFPNGQILPTPNLRIFSFAELKLATKSFRPETVLGEGGFGKVYKGKHGSGTVIAVKKLNSESLQGLEEWQSEINFLGTLSHPNLVRLLGYCLEDNELLLVYEFMQKGSLENHLFGRGAAVQPLPWEIRLKIAIGAARGLAKISDFGLAKFGPSASQSHVTTRVMGTYGYAAPEYVSTGHLYVKSDVYGFGVVLVEILTGLRALDTNRPSGKHTLTDWIKPYLNDKRKLKSIMDPNLEGKYPSKAAFRIAQLALTCLEMEPKNRPSMREVVETLERIESSKDRTLEPRNRSKNHHRPGSHRPGQQQSLQYRSPLHPQPQDAGHGYRNSPRVR
ncbi:Probable serine/threonine-protein kinase PIX13 [Linum perenne]